MEGELAEHAAGHQETTSPLRSLFGRGERPRRSAPTRSASQAFPRPRAGSSSAPSAPSASSAEPVEPEQPTRGRYLLNRVGDFRPSSQTDHPARGGSGVHPSSTDTRRGGRNLDFIENWRDNVPGGTLRPRGLGGLLDSMWAPREDSENQQYSQRQQTAIASGGPPSPPHQSEWFAEVEDEFGPMHDSQPPPAVQPLPAIPAGQVYSANPATPTAPEGTPIDQCAICAREISEATRAQVECDTVGNVFHYFHYNCLKAYIYEQRRRGAACVCPVCIREGSEPFLYFRHTFTWGRSGPGGRPRRYIFEACGGFADTRSNCPSDWDGEDSGVGEVIQQLPVTVAQEEILDGRIRNPISQEEQQMAVYANGKNMTREEIALALSILGRGSTLQWSTHYDLDDAPLRTTIDYRNRRRRAVWARTDDEDVRPSRPPLVSPIQSHSEEEQSQASSSHNSVNDSVWGDLATSNPFQILADLPQANDS